VHAGTFRKFQKVLGQQQMLLLSAALAAQLLWMWHAVVAALPLWHPSISRDGLSAASARSMQKMQQ
jgi:hypothetical protein